jgi:hypothetical protein
LLFYFFDISSGINFTKRNSTILLMLKHIGLNDFPRGHEAYLKFKDEDGQVWTFRCIVPQGGGSKPALYGDWFLFVRSKDLKVGDKIEIALDREKDQTGGSQFTIKVKRTTSTTRCLG